MGNDKDKLQQTGSPNDMTVKQAGHRGGTTTRDRHGRTYYQSIGRKGGRKTAQLYRELLTEVGKRGGRPRRPALDESMGEETSRRR
jgi:general stress protein YciG